MKHDASEKVPSSDTAEQTFGRRVARLRRLRNLTQEDTARALTSLGRPTHQTTVAKIEKGTRPTPVGEIVALAAVLGVPVAALFGEPGGGEDPVIQDLESQSRWLQAERVLIEARLTAVEEQLEAARTVDRN